MTPTHDEIEQIVNYFFDKTIYSDKINNPNNSTFKQSILRKGFSLYKRGGLYNEFLYLIKEKEDFLNYVIVLMNNDYQKLEKWGKTQYLADDTMGLLFNAFRYLKFNDIENDFFRYALCGIILIEYYLHDIFYIFYRGNGINSMSKINLYDIVRYYLFYQTVKMLDINYDENRFYLAQNPNEGIEFGNIIIKLPIIHNKQLELVTAQEVMESSQFYSIYESIKNENNDNRIVENKHIGCQTKELLGSELKAMYKDAYYCSKKHCGNITSLPIQFYLECVGILDDETYKVSCDGQYCYVFDSAGKALCDFGHFIIDTVSDDILLKIKNNSVKDSHCPECGVLMKMHYAKQGQYQGYLQCPNCRRKEYLILLGYRHYDPSVGKGRYKMSEYFMNLIKDM